jgi:hypothetical protein
MDAETIENFVIRLGRDDFQKVVALLLRSVFGLNAINVDGTNDAGTDWRVFKDGGGSTSAAYQDIIVFQTRHFAPFHIKSLK